MGKYLKGQGLVEYALLLALVAMLAMLGLQAYGTTLEQAYCNIGASFGNIEACEKYYCQDDFSSGSGGWSMTQNQPPSNNWEFQDGQLCAKGSSTIYNACAASLSTGDYTINLDVTTLYKGDGYGVYFRSTVVDGKVNGYTFQYDPGLKTFVFRKWVDGKELAPFAKANMPPNYDWYGEGKDIQVKVSGNTFTAYVDGVEVLTGTDDTYSDGGAGLRTWDSTQFCTSEFNVGPNLP